MAQKQKEKLRGTEDAANGFWKSELNLRFLDAEKCHGAPAPRHWPRREIGPTSGSHIIMPSAVARSVQPRRNANWWSVGLQGCAE